MKKNIWIMNHYATDMYLDKSGRHYCFANNLIKKGYRVTIFCASTIHNSSEVIDIGQNKYMISSVDEIKFVFVKTSNYVANGKKRIKNMIDFYRNLFSTSKKYAELNGRPDTIIASSVHPLAWLAGYKISKKFNSKFIAETRDLWPETLVVMGKLSRNGIPARILYKLEKYIYKKADKLIFTFPGGKDYAENIGIDASKIRYINNGIDLDDYFSNKTEFIYNDDDLNSNGKYKILFTGSIGKANSIDRIINVASILKERGYINIIFLIFGDGPEKENLQKFVQSNQIENVKFKGKVQKKYIPDILSRGDLNLFCLEHLPDLFKYGLSPNKMFDYFASGHPIVSNVECGYDMLEKYNCGLTVKGGSAEALAEGILKFYNMPKEEYDIYCQNALKAARNFDFKVLTDKLEKVILED